MGQSAASGYRHLEHDPGGEGGVALEVPVEGAVGMVLRDEPEFRSPVVGHPVAGEEPQDVVVTKEDGVVDLGLSEPKVFALLREFLDCHRLSLKPAGKDTAVAALPDALPHLHTAGQRPLLQ